jgi:hypothetical protein
MKPGIAATEAALDALADPGKAIDQRFGRVVEVNDAFGRPPSSIQEANTWSRESGHGLFLEEHENHVVARIPELPVWRIPLNEQQIVDLNAATRRGNEIGRELNNIDMPPRQRGRDHGTGYGSGD